VVAGRRGRSGRREDEDGDEEGFVGLDGVAAVVLLLPKLALHRSVSHKQAVIPAPGVSEMSKGEHVLLAVRGEEMGPKRIEVEKHSLISDVSASDFCQEYHKQASPGLHLAC